tara:strand:- start:1361 stop:1663 length:303 start_codon:yes stop_codon:yes gene_type:complete
MENTEGVGKVIRQRLTQTINRYIDENRLLINTLQPNAAVIEEITDKEPFEIAMDELQQIEDNRDARIRMLEDNDDAIYVEDDGFDAYLDDLLEICDRIHP